MITTIYFIFYLPAICFPAKQDSSYENSISWSYKILFQFIPYVDWNQPDGVSCGIWEVNFYYTHRWYNLAKLEKIIGQLKTRNLKLVKLLNFFSQNFRSLRFLLLQLVLECLKDFSQPQLDLRDTSFQEIYL